MATLCKQCLKAYEFVVKGSHHIFVRRLSSLPTSVGESFQITIGNKCMGHLHAVLLLQNVSNKYEYGSVKLELLG